MNLTAWWVKPLIGIALLVGLVAGVSWLAGHERDVGFKLGQAELNSENARLFALATAKARTEFERKQTNVEKAHAEDLKRADARIAAGAAARTELERLRARLANPGPGGTTVATSAGPGADATGSVARELLGACASDLTDLAEEAGRVAGQAIGLQAYVLANEIEGTPATATPVGERPRAGADILVTQPTTALSWNPPGAAPPKGQL